MSYKTNLLPLWEKVARHAPDEGFGRNTDMWNAKAMTKFIAPVSPGEMLEKEFLLPLGLTKYRLAKSIGVPAQRIGDIVAGKRGITADTDLRLCRFFGLSEGWWLKLQAGYDTSIARRKLGKTLDKIVPLKEVA